MILLNITTPRQQRPREDATPDPRPACQTRQVQYFVGFKMRKSQFVHETLDYLWHNLYRTDFVLLFLGLAWWFMLSASRRLAPLPCCIRSPTFRLPLQADRFVSQFLCGLELRTYNGDPLTATVHGSLEYPRVLVAGSADEDGDGEAEPAMTCGDPVECVQRCKYLARTSANGAGAPATCALCTPHHLPRSTRAFPASHE